MSIDIKIKDNLNDIRIHYGNIKNYKTYKLLPGITVLTGCNGYGKSTTVDEIKHDLNTNKVSFVIAMVPEWVLNIQKDVRLQKVITLHW